jgi:hypothetical protein
MTCRSTELYALHTPSSRMILLLGSDGISFPIQASPHHVVQFCLFLSSSSGGFGIARTKTVYSANGPLVLGQQTKS